MQYYIEITLLPNAEIPIYFLWEKVYQQIHLALVEIKKQDGVVSIGAAFPEYDAERKSLGNKLRLFSKIETELVDLNLSKWLSRLVDYVHVTSTRCVPIKTEGYAIYRRVQTKSSTERLARRKAKREGISFDSAMQILSGYHDKRSNLPYIHTKSLSSKNKYRLIISCTEVDTQSNDNSFSAYGLGHNSTVPLF